MPLGSEPGTGPRERVGEHQEPQPPQRDIVWVGLARQAGPVSGSPPQPVLETREGEVVERGREAGPGRKHSPRDGPPLVATFRMKERHAPQVQNVGVIGPLRCARREVAP